MLWNVDFEISSIVYQVVFLCFFIWKKHLPTRQNRLYYATLMVSFVALVLDVLTSVLNSYVDSFGVQLVTAMNIIYYLILAALSVLFFSYVLALTDNFDFFSSTTYMVFMIPAVIAVLVDISTPVTGFLFQIDENLRFTHRDGLIITMIADSFYVVMAFVFVVALRKKISRIKRYTIYICSVPLIVGVILESVFFQNVLIVNMMTTVTIIAIYLSLENPDMYIDNTSRMFNGDAFRVMADEYMKKGTAFSCVFLTISEYKNLDVLYGPENVQEATKDVVRYLKKVFSSRKIYRTKPWTFVFQEDARGDYEQIVNQLTNRFSKPFKGVDMDIMLEPEIVVIPYWHMPSDVNGIDSIHAFVKKMNGGHITGVIEVDDRLMLKIEHERAVEHAVELAISTGSIQIYFQPIYSAREGRITSCEALARLFDEETGFISPDEFIRKAEENGSITALGIQIFEKVCIFLKEQRPEQMGIEHIHVNLSPVQFKQENLASELIELTNKHDVDRSKLVLEITETAAVEESLVIHGNMDRLINAGFIFSLDDYGTGFSNTASIIQLPFSSVKLDKSLVWAFFNRKSNILPDLVNMFIHQKLELIAEGVETREMVRTLDDMNCNYMQGFYFSKPLPPREFISFVWEYNRNR